MIHIVTPIYHDVESFLILRERIAQLLPGEDLRFVAADDSAGRDPQMERVRELGDTVVTPPFNLGHQRAIVYAVRTIAPEIDDEDVVVTLDSDGEDRPEDLPRLVAELRSEGSERALVLALRTGRTEPLAFKVLYFFFRIGFRVLTGAVVRSGNFAAYRGWMARNVLISPQFDLSYSAALISLELGVTYVPCDRGERYAGESRMGYRRLLLHGLSMLMPFTDRIAVRALITFSITMALSVLGALAVVCVKLFTSEGVPGWATYTLLTLIVLSVLALGNFVVLFVVFAQSRALSLAGLEERAE